MMGAPRMLMGLLLCLARWLPESPRFLLAQGDAAAVVFDALPGDQGQVRNALL